MRLLFFNLKIEEDLIVINNIGLDLGQIFERNKNYLGMKIFIKNFKYNEIALLKLGLF